MRRITVFTPTYNREKTLNRVFQSLCCQTYKDFIWIIVDDGSTDNTREIVERFQQQEMFPIKYIYQENSGKHTAINKALKETDSELFLIADSDDSFSYNALEVFINTWDSIPCEKKHEYKGVIAKCYDAETKQPIGIFSEKIFDSNDLDAYFKLNLRFEKWNIVRTDIMKEISFPEPNEKLKFYPESVVWWRMARIYKTRYVDANIRAYYRDQDNSLITQSGGRSKETRYLWLFYINEAMDYFWSSPKEFAKAYVGYARDSILAGMEWRKSLEFIEGRIKRLIVFFIYPLGFIYAQKKRGGKAK